MQWNWAWRDRFEANAEDEACMSRVLDDLAHANSGPERDDIAERLHQVNGLLPQKSGIDYSRWDHLSCYSSEDNCDSDGGAYAPDPPGADDDFDEQDDQSGPSSESESGPDTALASGHHDFDEQDDLYIATTLLDDADAPSVVSEPDKIKQRWLVSFQQAGAQVHAEVLRLANGWREKGLNPDVLFKLDDIGQRQIQSYISHLRRIEDSEFDEDKGAQLLEMLGKWREQQLDHLHELAERAEQSDRTM